jgi:hypothetical protein
VIIPFNNPNTPSTAIPRRRNGIEMIQKIGYKTIAKIARGQQSIKRIIQNKNVSM